MPCRCGSTPVAKYIYATAAAAGKRVQALGGAKNHMIVLPDADIDEACRQYGLVSSATAETGIPAAILSAAAMVCEWRASDAAQDFDFDTDGQSYKRGSVAQMWADRAAASPLRSNSTRSWMLGDRSLSGAGQGRRRPPRRRRYRLCAADGQDAGPDRP